MVNINFDQSSFLMNYTGRYTDEFNYSYGYTVSEDEWIEEETIFTYDINYSYYSNTTLTGNLGMQTALNAYRVDISYGKGLTLIWFALRDGTYEIVTYLTQLKQDYLYSNEYNRKAETTYNKYNLSTMTLLDTWSDVVEDRGNWTSIPAPPLTEYDYQYNSMSLDFTMPLILTIEVFETQNKEKVAWAEMFSDFYVFNDSDKNAIYSLGETKNAPTLMSLQSSDEQCGAFIPWAVEWDIYSEWKEIGLSPENMSYAMKFPGDFETNEISGWIEFTPPELLEDDIIWEINYPNYPIWANIQPLDNEGNPKYTYYCGWDAPYSTTSPGNFSYQFDFNISDNRADLDLTTSLPKLSNSAFYGAVQGLSLAIPHYSFFLSSAELEETAKKIITVPSNLFNYDVNETKVAEINMENPNKKYYTIFDYPKEGESRQIESIGSTVSKVVSHGFEFNPTTPRNYFVDTILSIKDLSLVKDDPDLNSPYSLYNIQIQNYPVWSGEKIVHDPRFSAYFSPTTGLPDQPSIPGVYMSIIVCLIVTITSIEIKYKKRRSN